MSTSPQLHWTLTVNEDLKVLIILINMAMPLRVEMELLAQLLTTKEPRAISCHRLPALLDLWGPRRDKLHYQNKLHYHMKYQCLPLSPMSLEQEPLEEPGIPASITDFEFVLQYNNNSSNLTSRRPLPNREHELPDRRHFS